MRLLSNLIYADEIVLLAHCAVHLQQLLDYLLTFCTAMGLQISKPNTNVMIFRRLGRQSTVQKMCSPWDLCLSHTPTLYLGVNITSSGNPRDYMPPARRNIASAYHRMRQHYCSLAWSKSLQLLFSSGIVTSTVWQRAMGGTSADSCRA